MDRRDFVKASLLAMGSTLFADDKDNGLVVSPTGFSESFNVPHTLPPGKLKVQYIREDIPPFQAPSPQGSRYTDTVPDTLDIAERGKLCVNALTSITDGNADAEVYWLATFYRNPPVMEHNFNDWVQNVEGMMEALPLLRVATGSTQNDHVDTEWMRVLLKSVGARWADLCALPGPALELHQCRCSLCAAVLEAGWGRDCNQRSHGRPNRQPDVVPTGDLHHDGLLPWRPKPDVEIDHREDDSTPQRTGREPGRLRLLSQRELDSQWEVWAGRPPCLLASWRKRIAAASFRAWPSIIRRLGMSRRFDSLAGWRVTFVSTPNITIPTGPGYSARRRSNG